MDLARAGFNVAIVEETNYLGGGFWMGGYLMNKVTVRKPGHVVLEEIGCPYDEPQPGLCVIDAAHGAMLLSGRRAAELAAKEIRKRPRVTKKKTSSRR